jgi:hypothetical protein
MATFARNMAPVKLCLALKSYAPLEAHPRSRAHPALIALALFTLAFGATFFVLNRPGSPASEASSRHASISPSDSARPAVDVLAASVASTPPPPPPPPPSLPEPAVTADDLDSSLPPPDSPPPDDFAQTLDTLRSGTPEDRVAAIQTLAATSPGGLAFGHVRQSLRFAAADPDPEIAARAQEAYDSLMKRDDP